MEAIFSLEKLLRMYQIKHCYNIIKGEYLVKNTTDIRIDVIFYD